MWVDPLVHTTQYFESHFSLLLLPYDTLIEEVTKGCRLLIELILLPNCSDRSECAYSSFLNRRRLAC